MTHRFCLVCWACETVLVGYMTDVTGAELPLDDFCVCPRCGERYSEHPCPEGERLYPPESPT